MGLNDIQLTATQLADLYSNVLVETAEKRVPEKEKPAEKDAGLRFLGKNEKQVLIMVNNPEQAFLSDKSLAFITAVLQACGLGLSDVAITNWHLAPLKNAGAIETAIPHRIALLFNLDPLSFGLPVKFPLFQVQHFNGKTYMHAPALDVIETDVSLKKQLWTALKAIFSI